MFWGYNASPVFKHKSTGALAPFLNTKALAILTEASTRLARSPAFFFF
jgi:hypothetical protein